MSVILTPTMARTKLLLVLLAVGVYAGTPPVYVFFRVRAASRRAGGGDDVLDRQRAVQAAAGEALRDTVLWLALGALCAPLVISLVRRRALRPLGEVDAGLARVAQGDLTVELAVPPDDE